MLRHLGAASYESLYGRAARSEWPPAAPSRWNPNHPEGPHPAAASPASALHLAHRL